MKIIEKFKKSSPQQKIWLTGILIMFIVVLYYLARIFISNGGNFHCDLIYDFKGKAYPEQDCLGAYLFIGGITASFTLIPIGIISAIFFFYSKFRK